MVDLFLSYLKTEKRLSPHTVTAYSNDLQQFSDFLQVHFHTQNILEVQFREIRSWLAALIEDKISPVSVNRKIATLRSFYKFLERRGHLTVNPMIKIHSLKTPSKLPVFLEEKSMNTLFENLDCQEGNFNQQEELILELFYGTGMRLSELIHLKIKDIDIFDQKINVLGKRNKQRYIPLTNHLVTKLKDFLATIHTSDLNQYLFMGNSGKMLYPMYVQRLVKKHLGTVSTDKKRSPHVLRHTFATHLLNKGAELNAIKELLGHASLSATQIYTHNSIEKLKAIHKKAHPKSE